MSLGGVLGGAFNSLIAPFLFVLPLEYIFALSLALLLHWHTDTVKQSPLATPTNSASLAFNISLLGMSVVGIVLCFIVPFLSDWHSDFKTDLIVISVLCTLTSLILSIVKPRIFMISAILGLILHAGANWYSVSKLLYIERNFFGVSQVLYDQKSDTNILVHGNTRHGAQIQKPAHALKPTTYYTRPVEEIFNAIGKPQNGAPQKVAAIGLGVGSIACYRAENRHFTFYEIDPAVIRIAENQNLFTFLSNCGSSYTIIKGDGRLQITKQAPATYDVIFLDAFSSDNIPIHLITKNAFEVYLSKMKDDGLLVVHLSNRFLDLPPVVKASANALDVFALFKATHGEIIKGTTLQSNDSLYAILSRNPKILSALSNEGWTENIVPIGKPWTDDYSSLLQALRFGKHVHTDQGSNTEN